MTSPAPHRLPFRARLSPFVTGFLLTSVPGCFEAPEAFPPEPTSRDGGQVDDAGNDAGSEGLPDAGPALFAPPERTWSTAYREEAKLNLLIEIWPNAVAACVPPADVDVERMTVLGIHGWDGTAQTFVLDQDGPHGRAAGTSGGISADDRLTGTLTVEPFDETPRYLSFDIDPLGQGRIDLSLCGDFTALKE